MKGTVGTEAQGCNDLSKSQQLIWEELLGEYANCIQDWATILDKHYETNWNRWRKRHCFHIFLLPPPSPMLAKCFGIFSQSPNVDPKRERGFIIVAQHILFKIVVFSGGGGGGCQDRIRRQSLCQSFFCQQVSIICWRNTPSWPKAPCFWNNFLPGSFTSPFIPL